MWIISGDNNDSGTAAIIRQPIDEFNPLDARHDHIQNDDIGIKFTERCFEILGAIRDPDIVIHTFGDPANEIAKHFLIIYYQYTLFTHPITLYLLQNLISLVSYIRSFPLPEQEFTIIIKEAIKYNQLEKYFRARSGAVQDVSDHFDLSPDTDAIERDKSSAGGLKLSHAQRRMLILLTALWDERQANRIFADGAGSLGTMIQSMDPTNRDLFADLVVTYPGWGS